MSSSPIIDRYTRLRDRILERLKKVNRTTEDAVLAAGEHLKVVALTARKHIEQLREVLGGSLGASDSELRRAIATQAAHVREHGRVLGAAVSEQAAEVATVAEQARLIMAAAAQIERTNTAARVLSINVRIESARSGSEVFKAIAKEMQDLARSIGEANQRISQLATSMETTLPRLVSRSAELSTMVSQFAHEAHEQIEHIDQEIIEMRTQISASMTSSDGALAAIIEASYAGLSALQFQDVSAQSLLQIDTWQAAALRETAAELGVEAAVEAELDAISTEDEILDHQNAGEVMLF